jgi:co-chaperonin GroES (HSP10)
MKIDQIVPLHDRVFVEQDAQETETEAGIALHKGSLPEKNTFTVLAVGPDVKDSRIVKGARIVAGPYSRVYVDDLEVDRSDKTRYQLVPEETIYAIIA